MNRENIVEFPPERSVARSGGDDFDARLRAAEEAIREIKADVKGFDDRLRTVEGDTREIKVQLQHFATRAWIQGGILAGMGVAAGIGAGLAKIFTAP